MKDRILNILKEENRAYSAIELKDILGLNTTEEITMMMNTLNELESDLTIYHTNKDKYIDFEVRNKSEFLTENDLANIFDKYKSKSNSKISKISTGLGLYISKQIVEKHKGEIYAKCTDKDTYIFGFKIPKDCNKEA